MKSIHFSLSNLIGVTLILGAAGLQVPAAKAETSSSFIETPLMQDFRFNATPKPGPGEEFKYAKYTLPIDDEFDMGKDEIFRIIGQTSISLDSQHPIYSSSGARFIPYEYAEVNNAVVCEMFNTSTGAWDQASDTASAGTNHHGQPGQRITFSNSLLLKATTPGKYRCRIINYASHDDTADFFATVHSDSTFLERSSANEKGAEAFVHLNCPSNGTGQCEYLPNFSVVDVDDPDSEPSPTFIDDGNPQAIKIRSDLPKKSDNGNNTDWNWKAADNATLVELIGTYQITSCPHYTSSCTSFAWGPPADFGKAGKTHAQIATRLHFDQVFEDNSVCQANQSDWQDFDITKEIHHQPINYRLEAAVSSTCQGSRKFLPYVEVKWLESDNPVKIDGGIITVINLVRNDTGMVPDVLRSNLDQANARLQAAGFIPTVTGIVDPAPVDTVLNQNAPGGTVEPLGSTVALTVSSGSATVPNVASDFETAAIRRIVAANLSVGTISRPNTCVDPGTVQSQSLDPGSMVAIGTSIDLTVPGCVRRGGGGPRPLPQ